MKGGRKLLPTIANDAPLDSTNTGLLTKDEGQALRNCERDGGF